jgi:serine/threonine-protein kinase
LKLLGTQAAPSRDLDRFTSEVRLARDIAHPNVCRVYDIGHADGWHYLSMEYVDGETLASLLRRIGRMPREKALDIARQLSAGLAAAHDLGVLHRDIKPSNIMLDGRGRVRLMDFGLAVPIGEFVAGEVVGTAAYMAPEQLAGDRATERTDLYALGVVLYELFTGHRLFAVRSVDERLFASYNGPVPEEVFRDLDPAVGSVIRSCLQNDPVARPVAAGAVAAALPGGDQLTAAVAQGRLLEPEMVAAAGEKVRWHPAVAWTMFGATMIMLLGVAARIGTMTQIQPSSFPKPPEVLIERAREILALANHQGSRVDSAVWFAPELISGPSGARSNAPASRFRFTYRQSPTYLIPQGLMRTVSELDPAPDVPGMVSVTLDASGRLIRFAAVPQDKKPAAIPTGTDWTSLFSAAGLNLHEFDVVESDRIPSVAHDDELAWKLRGAGGTSPAVAAATLNGIPVYFEVRSESPHVDNWLRALPTRRPPAAEAFFWATIVLLFVAATLMARYNLRREAGDREGARKLSVFVIAGGLLASVAQSHHAPVATDELVLLLSLAGWTLMWASLFWLVYMALEPGVRQLWPHTLITWTRLIAGRARDPLVGRDLLVGVAVGVTLVALRFAFTNEPVPNYLLWPALESLRSSRHFLAMLLVSLLEAPEYALAGFFFLLIVRTLVKNTLVAAILVGVLSLPIIGGGMAQDSWRLTLYALTLGLVAPTVGLRLGLLAWTTALFVQFLLTRLPITLDTSAWYYESSVLTLLLIGGLAAYGCLVHVQAAPHRIAAKTLPT